MCTVVSTKNKMQSLHHFGDKSIGMNGIVHCTAARSLASFHSMQIESILSAESKRKLTFPSPVILNHWWLIDYTFFPQKLHGTLDDRLRMVRNLAIEQLSEARISDGTMCLNVMNGGNASETFKWKETNGKLERITYGCNEACENCIPSFAWDTHGVRT